MYKNLESMFNQVNTMKWITEGERPCSEELLRLLLHRCSLLAKGFGRQVVR